MLMMSLYQKAEEPGGSPFSSVGTSWMTAAGDALAREKKRKRKERTGACRRMTGRVADVGVCGQGGEKGRL